MDSETYKKTTEKKVNDDGSSRTEEHVKNTSAGTERKTIVEEKPVKTTITKVTEED